MRVEIPAYTDRWMMGDRYGEVVRTHVQKPGVRAQLLRSNRSSEVALVKLDKSGKRVRVYLDDCRVL
jgi:hypothetical protein